MTVGRRRSTALVAVSALALAGLGWGTAEAAQRPQPVTVQLINVSDWHGQLDPLAAGGPGGAPILSSYFKAERAANPNTITFTAGDAFGATPPLAGFFDEEPAVRSMRLMGFDVDGLGNHNWDKGNAHLQRMINIAGATVGEPGTPFRYLAANLSGLKGQLAGVAPYRIFERGDVKIGVVSVTNPDTRHRTGGLFDVHVVLSVPGHADIVVSRRAEDQPEREHISVSLRKAFAQARRRLQDTVREMRGDVKVSRARTRAARTVVIE